MNRNSFILTLTSLALISFLTTACSSSTKEQQEEQTIETESRDTQKIDLSATTIAYDNPSYTLSTSGEIRPYEQVALHPKVQGFIQKMTVDRGDIVKKGQILAILEAPEINQRYLADKALENKMYADYLLAKQVYERLLDASKTVGAVAQVELDRSQSAMNSAKSSYESAKASSAQSLQQQEYLYIKAPFDGIITQRYHSVGALISSNSTTPIFDLAQNDKLRLVIAIPEKHTAAVYDNLPVTYTVNAFPNQVMEATLSRTSGLLDTKDRSLVLEFDINNSNRNLKGGDYANATLTLKQPQPTFWVKTKSVLHTQSGNYIYVIDKDKNVSKIPVKIGAQTSDLTEVFGKITEGMHVLNKPSEEIKTIN